MKYAINEFSLYQLEGNLWHVISDETGGDSGPISESDFNEDAFTLFEYDVDCLSMSEEGKLSCLTEWMHDLDNN